MIYWIIAASWAVLGLVVLKYHTRSDLTPGDTSLVFLLAAIWPFSLLAFSIFMFFTAITWLVNKI